VGSQGGNVTQFWNFGTPSISRERLKLEARKYNSDQDQISGSSLDQQLHFVGGLTLSR